MPDANRPRVGNQTSYRAVRPTAPFDYALARGFDAFEWFPDRRPDGRGWSAADLGPAARAEIRRHALDRDVSLSVHAPMPADPANPEGIDDALRLAEDLGATLLNVHLGAPPSIGRFAEAVGPLARRCAGAGVALAIENTPADGPEAFVELFAARPEGVGMCLDLGHANLYPSTRNDMLGYMDRLASGTPIVHVHAHENHGDRDAHLPLFTGPAGVDESGIVGVIARLRQRQFRGSIILEQWPDPPDLLDRARAGLLRLFGEG